MKTIVVALSLALLSTPALAQHWHGGGGYGWGGGWHGGGWHGGWGGRGFIPVPIPPPYDEEYAAPARTCWILHHPRRTVCSEE